MLPSGRARTFDNRVGWALTYLSQAGLIARPRRGHMQITSSGRQALTAHPQRIDASTLEPYPSFVEFRERRTRRDSAAATAPDGVHPDLTEPSWPLSELLRRILYGMARR